MSGKLFIGDIDEIGTYREIPQLEIFVLSSLQHIVLRNGVLHGLGRMGRTIPILRVGIYCGGFKMHVIEALKFIDSMRIVAYICMNVMPA